MGLVTEGDYWDDANNQITTLHQQNEALKALIRDVAIPALDESRRTLLEFSQPIEPEEEALTKLREAIK